MAEKFIYKKLLKSGYRLDVIVRHDNIVKRCGSFKRAETRH